MQLLATSTLAAIALIATWTWAMLRGRPLVAAVCAAAGIAPVLQVASGLAAASVLDSGTYFSLPLGGSSPGPTTLALSLTFWMWLVADPSYRMARAWRQRLGKA